MKVRTLRLSGALVLSLLVLFVFFTVVGLAATDGESRRPQAIVTDDVATVRARDEITTVIGIDESPLRLSRDGQLVLATGKVECPEGGTYDLRVMVFQQKAPPGIAMGEASGTCGGDGSEWQEWQAEAVGTLQLTEGEAQVCAVVVVYLDRGTIAERSCRTLSLVE